MQLPKTLQYFLTRKFVREVPTKPVEHGDLVVKTLAYVTLTVPQGSGYSGHSLMQDTRETLPSGAAIAKDRKAS